MMDKLAVSLYCLTYLVLSIPFEASELCFFSPVKLEEYSH
jgi:hypothetical protein